MGDAVFEGKRNKGLLILHVLCYRIHAGKGTPSGKVWYDNSTIPHEPFFCIFIFKVHCPIYIVVLRYINEKHSIRYCIGFYMMIKYIKHASVII